MPVQPVGLGPGVGHLVGGLPVHASGHERRDGRVARLGRRVVLPLLDRPVVVGARVLAEGAEDRPQRGGAGGGQPRAGISPCAAAPSDAQSTAAR